MRKLYNLIFISGFIFLLCMIQASAWSTNTFNNSLPAENLTFTSINQNITRYLAVPQNTILINAFMNLTGYAPTPNAYFNMTFFYKFNQGSGTTVTDETGSHNAVYSGPFNWTATGGISGYGNYTNVTTGTVTGANTGYTPAAVDFNAFSVEFRIITKDGSHYWFGDGTGADPAKRGFSIKTSGAGIPLVVASNSTDFILNDFNFGCSAINDGIPHMIAVTVNTTHNWKMYRDGVLCPMNTTQNINGAGTDPIYIHNRPALDDGGDGGIDQAIWWNKTLTSAEVLANNNSATDSSGNYAASAIVSSLNVSIGGSLLSNISIAANGTTSVNIKTSNLYNTINNYISSCTITAGFCNVPITFTSSNVGTLGYLALIFNNTGFIENSQTYNSPVFAGSLQTFVLDFDYDKSSYSLVGTLNYNNVNYTGIKLNFAGNNAWLTQQITIPAIAGAQQNNTFYWIVSLNNGSSTENFLSTVHNQTVNSIGVDNCTTFTQHILNMNLFDQDARTPLSGTIETLLNIYDANFGSVITTFNNTINGQNSSICFQSGILNTTNYTMSYRIKFYSGSYSNQYVNAQNVSLVNASVPYNVNLYDLVSSNEQDCQITYRDEFLIPQSDVILSLQRQYLPINAFLEVESPLTDNNGQVILHFAKNNPVYNIIAKQNGQVLLTQSNVQLSTVAGANCQIQLNALSSNTQLGSYNSNFNINGAFSLSNSSISFIFTSLDGTPVTTSWNVILNNGYGNSTICTNSQTSSSGTLLCTVPAVYQNSSLIAIVYVNGNHYTSQGFTLGPTGTSIFGGARVILMLMMYMTIVFLFISSPEGMVIGAIVGMVFGGLLLVIDGLNLLNFGSIILFFIIAGGIIVWRLSKTIR